MKAVVLSENLLKTLSHMSRGAASKAALPVLMNTHILASESRLTFSATNLESGIIITMAGHVTEPGAVTIPAKIFHEFIATLGPGEVRLEGTDSALAIDNGRFQATLTGIPASEFPPFPQFPQDVRFQISAESLVLAIQSVSFAASQDEGRQILTGILFEITKEGAAFIATDGYRLSRIILQDLEETTEGAVVIPARCLNEAVRIFGDKGEEKIAIALTNNQIMLKGVETIFSSRTLDGQFPPYQKIIPTQFSTRVIVEREELIKAARVATVFAKDSANIIRFNVKPADPEPLQLSANTTQIGNEIGKLEASVEGEGVGIAFNSRYVLDVLSAIKTKQVSIEFSGSLSPGLFRPVGDSNVIHIIMPVRTQDA